MLLFGVRYPFEDHRRKFLDENVARYTKALETGSSWIDILPPLLKKLAILLPLARVTVVEEASRNIINFARYTGFLTFLVIEMTIELIIEDKWSGVEVDNWSYTLKKRGYVFSAKH